MLNTQTMQDILKEVFGVDPKYIVQLTNDEFVPTIDPEDKVGTWIGHMMLHKEPFTQAYSGSGDYAVIPMTVKFRLTFVGPQAEEFADSTLLWDVRQDVIDAFAKHHAQLFYMQRQLYVYPVKNKGYNDRLCWIVDCKAQTTYEADMKHVPWFPNHG